MHDIIEISSIEEPKFETSIIHGEDFVDAARLLGGKIECNFEVWWLAVHQRE